ncbi:SPRY domain-containing protein [Paenibacillus sp. NPDC058174]|uniref:SPRY domain-containing protein n=1 Tax=Paenibacillus sp. NPDC058174 TaxID=3346366 RepID=UPI0036DF5F23
MAIVTWDNVNKGSSVTLTNNNMTASIPNYNNTARASLGRNSGKWYWEISFSALTNIVVGIVNLAAGVASTVSSTNHRGFYSYSGLKMGGPTGQPYGSSYGTSDTIGILLDLQIGTIEFLKNNTSFGIAFSDLLTMGIVFPSVTAASGSGGGIVNVNFGNKPFKYAVPTGYRPYAHDEKALFMEGSQLFTYNNNTLQNVGSIPVTKEMFDTYGIELSVINRTLTTIGIPMNASSAGGDIFGSGKVFKGNINLSKYFDLLGINITN